MTRSVHPDLGGLSALRAPLAFDGERFRTDGATVLVRGGRIIGVEPARFDLPEECSVTDVGGTLLPGLIDAHVHLVSDAGYGALERAGAASDADLEVTIRNTLRTHAAAGVTTVVDLGDVGFRTLGHRTAEAPSPRLLAAGPPITIPSGHCHFLGGAVSGVAAIRAAVAVRAEHGVDVIKVMASGGMLTAGTDPLAAQFSLDELRALVSSAHDAGLRVHAHAHARSAVLQAAEAGVDGIEHFTCLTEHGPHPDDEILKIVAERGIVVDPTGGFVLEESMTPPPRVVEVMTRLGITLEYLTTRRVEDYGLLRTAGLTVVSGTDGGAAPASPHGIVARAVGELVSAGWPTDEALRTATSTAADSFGLSAETGRLRRGLAADLLVVDGDPRQQPSVLLAPTLVLVRGVPADAAR